jgi:hypothetical protein
MTGDSNMNKTWHFCYLASCDGVGDTVSLSEALRELTSNEYGPERLEEFMADFTAANAMFKGDIALGCVIPRDRQESEVDIFWLPCPYGRYYGFSWFCGKGDYVLMSPVELPYLVESTDNQVAIRFYLAASQKGSNC